jgi:glycosyltransferase involved in cell wall biosynthesis
MDLAGMRVGYVPYSETFMKPGDRRRFVRYAQRRGIELEIAKPGEAYDVVVLSERADISVWRDYHKGKIVYDLIDSYLAIPRTSLKGRLRGLAKFVSRQSKYLQLDYWKAVADMCRRADAVVCTTLEQQADIMPFCENVHIILDVHSMVVRDFKKSYKAGKPFRIVWEGLPHTLNQLEIVNRALNKLHRITPIHITIITDLESYRYLDRYGRVETYKYLKNLFPNTSLHEWEEETCSQLICGSDLAIIPLDLNDPFAAGKPENKMLLFWRMGMPVVASATPTYARAMEAAGLGMACANGDEWEVTLSACIISESVRRQSGERGRAFAEKHWSEDTILLKWDTLVESLWSKPRADASETAAPGLLKASS